MTILGIYQQQPGETLDYDINYRDSLGSGDYLTTIGAAVTPPGEMTASALIVNSDNPDSSLDDTRAKVWCTGGTSGTKYKVTVTATSFQGRVIESEFYVKVKEL